MGGPVQSSQWLLLNWCLPSQKDKRHECEITRGKENERHIGKGKEFLCISSWFSLGNGFERSREGGRPYSDRWAHSLLLNFTCFHFTFVHTQNCHRCNFGPSCRDTFRCQEECSLWWFTVGLQMTGRIYEGLGEQYGGGGDLRARPDRCGRRRKRSLGKIHLCVDTKHRIDNHAHHDALKILSAPSGLPLQLPGRVGGGGTPFTYRLTFVSRSYRHKAPVKTHSRKVKDARRRRVRC